MGSEAFQLPKIDLSSLEAINPGGEDWDTARAKMFEALVSYGCFEAVYDKVTPELREALFGRSMPELFSLPLEYKMRALSDVPYQGYLGQLPGMPSYESLRVDGAPNLEAVDKFTHLMWPGPGGNPSFRDTIWTFAKHLKDLEQMIERMILQCIGVEICYNSHIKSTAYGVRLSEYRVPLDQETKIAMSSHLDPHFVTIVCQHQVEGLEVQTRDGEWIHVVPSLNSFTVMIGEAFEAWTNGRLHPPYHRVRITSNEKRYSALFGSRPRDDCLVRAPEELVDEEHPLLYNPYYYNDYLRFRFSEEGAKAKHTMKAFCGVRSQEV